jgi:hypothetical protein
LRELSNLPDYELHLIIIRLEAEDLVPKAPNETIDVLLGGRVVGSDL